MMYVCTPEYYATAGRQAQGSYHSKAEMSDRQAIESSCLRVIA